MMMTSPRKCPFYGLRDEFVRDADNIKFRWLKAKEPKENISVIDFSPAVAIHLH